VLNVAEKSENFNASTRGNGRAKSTSRDYLLQVKLLPSPYYNSSLWFGVAVSGSISGFLGLGFLWVISDRHRTTQRACEILSLQHNQVIDDHKNTQIVLAGHIITLENCSSISHISRLACARTILGPLESVTSYTQSIDEMRTPLKRFWFQYS
jgi:hypothetical protein